MSPTTDPAGTTGTTGVRELLRAAAGRLDAAGVASPRVDAELLLAAALRVPRARLAAQPDVPTTVAAEFDRMLQRRTNREPLQHILGTAPFRHVQLAVGPGVFVPRPETELLVDAVLPQLRDLARPVVVDLCAGSGALAVALADEVPNARVVAVERDPGALPWLRRNAELAGVEVVAADVRDLAALAPLAGRADAVVANPPYVPAATPVSPEVLADPAEAVFAGADGLGLIPEVVVAAARVLRPGGLLALEHDDSHGATVPALLESGGAWAAVAGHRDLTGRPRYAVATRR